MVTISGTCESKSETESQLLGSWELSRHSGDSSGARLARLVQRERVRFPVATLRQVYGYGVHSDAEFL